MAAPNTNYDQVSAVTRKFFVPKLVDNIFDSGPMLARARKKFYKSVSGGDSIVQPLNYAQVTASGWYSGAETLDTSDNETITAAQYEWKQIYAAISITRKDELKNQGTSRVLDFVKSKMQIAEKTLKDKMAAGLYNDGSDAKAIHGLEFLCAIDNTVGGISQSSNSWWQAKLDSTTTTLTLAAMQSRYQATKVDSDKTTVIPCADDVYDLYYNLLTPQQRFADADTAKGGFSNLLFNGTPVVADSQAASGDMYFLNEKYLHLYYHPQENFRFEPFMKPINQNVKVAKIFWMGAFGSSNLRLQGLMNGITA
jgi:hypothetical protein